MLEWGAGSGCAGYVAQPHSALWGWCGVHLGEGSAPQANRQNISLWNCSLRAQHWVTHLEGERWGTATAGSLWEDKLLCSKTDHPPAVHCTFCLNCCRLWRMSSPWGLVSLHLPHEIEGLASTFPINYCYCKEGNRQGKDFLVILATFCLQKAHVVGEFQNASMSREGRCTVETFEGDE